jgi:chromosome segregation ATPase
MSEATNPPAGGKELTREQLLTYVKKAKLKIRKLESEVLELKEKAAQPALEVPSEAQDDVLASMWGGITSMATGIVTEVTSVVKDEADDNDASSTGGSASSVGNAPPASASIYRDGEGTLNASNLDETNAQLTTELKQIKELLREKTQMVDVLGDQVVKAETEIMTITQKLEEGQTQLAQMQSLISSLTEDANSEKCALQAQLVSTENKLSESRTSTKIAQDEMNKWRVEKDAEKERWKIEKMALEASVAEQSKLFKEAEDKAQQLIESEGKRSGEVKDKDDLEMAVAEQKKRAEKAEEEIMVLCEQQVAAENDVEKLQGKIKELEQENVHAAMKIEKAGSHMAAADSAAGFEEKMKTLEKERDALKAAVEFNVSNEKSSSSKLSQTEELQKKTLAKLKEIKSENLKLRHELKELKSIHEKISKDDTEMQSKVASHKDELLAQLKEKDETIIAAEAALLKAKEDLSAKENDCASSKAEKKAHMTEVEKHKCEIETLKKEAQKHKNDAEKHKSEAAKLKSGTEKHQTEVQRLRDEIEKRQAEAKAMKAAFKKDEAALQAFRKAEEGLKANTADSNGKISSLQSEVSALKQQIECLEKDAKSTTTTLHESQAQVIALEDNLRSLTSES